MREFEAQFCIGSLISDKFGSYKLSLENYFIEHITSILDGNGYNIRFSYNTNTKYLEIMTTQLTGKIHIKYHSHAEYREHQLKKLGI